MAQDKTAVKHNHQCIESGGGGDQTFKAWYVYSLRLTKMEY